MCITNASQNFQTRDYFVFSDAANSFTQSQPSVTVSTMGTNLVSKDGDFVLGFFCMGNSNNHYLEFFTTISQFGSFIVLSVMGGKWAGGVINRLGA